MGIIKEERIGGQRLILGDCLEIMPELGRFDAVVTDPPYGINYTGNGGKGWVNRNATFDGKRPSLELFQSVIEISNEQIIWGGNYFELPPVRGWLTWFKPDAPPSLGQFEMAWTSIDRTTRQISQSIAATNAERIGHPTQKPLRVMEWCLGFLPDAVTILDPFMGSGTTLVACQRMGRQGTGIELDPEYFDIACKRVDEATRQPDMFVQAVEDRPTQESLF